MAHEPFIWGAYSFAFVAMAWCALAPLLKGKRLVRQLRSAWRRQEAGSARSA